MFVSLHTCDNHTCLHRHASELTFAVSEFALNSDLGKNLRVLLSGIEVSLFSCFIW